MDDTTLETPLARGLYGSAIKKAWVKAALLVVAVLLVIWAWPNFVKYYAVAPIQILAGIAAGVVFYFPTLLVLGFMMRRKRVPLMVYFAIPASVVLFFGPITSRANNIFMGMELPTYAFVGFSEETAKILPLLLIVLFARPAITGVRDGVLFGALGGFGFAVLEMAVYFALEDYPNTGWAGFFSGSAGRATFFGTDSHILWSAFLGGAIGYGLTVSRGKWKVIVPVLAYVGVVVFHGMQDSLIGKLMAIFPGVILMGGIEMFGVSEETLAPLIEIYMLPMLMFDATVNMLLINMVTLPILIFWVLKSGNSDREIIKAQLAEEGGAIVLEAEKQGLETQRRYHHRKIGTDTQGKIIVRAQNELAFRKAQIGRTGGTVENDPIVVSLRHEIAQLRG